MNHIQPRPQYFEVFRALHRGGLSLLLNRKTLLPMTMIPTVVTFLTLMLMRGGMPQDTSPFLMAVVQIPSDFVTGLLCALIIFIILSAPKKRDNEKPVIFTLNLNEKKGLFISAALANVVFSYFLNGMYGLLTLIYEPLQQASQTAETPPSMAAITGLSILLFILFYAVRFIMLPVLIIAHNDIRGFFARNKQVGFSFPIFVLKILTTFSIGFCVLMISSPFLASASGEGQSIPTIQLAIIDFITAFGSVLSSAWVYAALAVGYRQMTEGKVK